MMQFIFYFSSVIAICAALLTITRKNAVHALLYLVVSLLAVAVMFFVLGAPFAAALEIIIYAGAIMVMFIFVVLILNVNNSIAREEIIFSFKVWAGPSVLAFILLIQFFYIIHRVRYDSFTPSIVGAKDVGISLFSTYLLCVELGGLLLLAGVIGAYHLGKERKKIYHRFLKGDSE